LPRYVPWYISTWDILTLTSGPSAGTTRSDQDHLKDNLDYDCTPAILVTIFFDSLCNHCMYAFASVTSTPINPVSERSAGDAEHAGRTGDRITPAFPLAAMLSRPGLHQASTLAQASLQRQSLCLCVALKSFSRQKATAAYSTSTKRGGSSS
jgi:hypothetical protein